MNYPANFEEKIGFARVRELVSENCLFEPGKALIANLEMMFNAADIEEQLDLVEEFRRIQLSDEDFPIHQFYDCRAALKKAKIEGTHLEIEEVAGLAKSLESVRLILKFFESREDDDYPRLRELSKSVKLYPFVSERIAQILNKHGKIKDNASKDLLPIRRAIISKESSVTRQMNKILKMARSEGWVEEDMGSTLRNGRQVIPVSASYKRSLGGLIHDESTSGKTVFIEPSEVVHLTNEIRELEYAEKREIIKILTAFTDAIRPYISELEDLHSFLGEIDSIRARALFAIRIQAKRPKIMKDPGVSWINAVHPLLFLALQQSGREVISLSLELDLNNHLLLISGPNAGGKSVCLQTTGLLQYMVQCGLLVPADENSKVGVFSGIFIDIGDEQSIDNDLSTYSSHLLNMKHFLKNAKDDSLVLIDEFGTGTEPLLGGAIAESILEYLNNAGTFGVLTTHYTNLKHYAASSEGIINGAMLFDNHQMQPLYELQVGKPGSSFAFEIARKIGLPEEVLEKASQKVGQDHIDFDKHLRDILRDKKYWERKRQKIRQSEKKLEELMLKYEDELGTSEKKRKALIDEAKKKAETMITGANRTIENTIREIKEANAEKLKTREARGRLDKFREGIDEEDQVKKDQLAREYNELKKRAVDLGRQRPDIRQRVKTKPSPEKKIVDETIRAGDMVKISGQETEGEVMEVKGKNAVIIFGNLKSTVKLEKLTKTGTPKKSNREIDRKSRSGVNLGEWNISKRRVQFKSEIDIRGKRAEEALRLVTELLDEGVMVGSHELRILHGKGDGILRQLIRDFLNTNDVVEWFGDEHIERGGAGITVVRLGF